MGDHSLVNLRTPEELEAFADSVDCDDVTPLSPEVVEAQFARIIATLMRDVAVLQRRNTRPQTAPKRTPKPRSR